MPIVKSSKRRLVIIIALIAILSATGLYVFYNSPMQRIKRHGYDTAEAQILLAHLDDSDLSLSLRQGYQPWLVAAVQDDDFAAERLENYLYLGTTTDFTTEQIIALGNHPDFDAQENYTTAKYTILTHPYYRSERRQRYFDQLALTDDQDNLSDLIALVNANRDYEYYTHTAPAETTHGAQLLVNKYYYLEQTYQPELVALDVQYGSPDLEIEREAYQHFQEMFAAALADGYQLYVTSAYRGYADQETVFEDYRTTVGEAEALVYAAAPGFSEHQTGRAIDVFVPGETTTTFRDHPAAAWLAEHAHEYGFILRYPEDKVDLTGYQYEAWHYRYVGAEAAQYIYEHNLTFEEYWTCFVA